MHPPGANELKAVCMYIAPSGTNELLYKYITV